MIIRVFIELSVPSRQAKGRDNGGAAPRLRPSPEGAFLSALLSFALNFSNHFFNIFNDDNTSINLTKLSLIDLFPEEMAQKLEALNIVPVIMNDEIQLIMPYSINVN